ncbi:MAG: hypothetical protein ACLR1G_02155 [Alistipes indistinctus]
MSRINLEYFLARRIAFTRGGRKNNVMVRIATLSVAVGMAVMIVSLAVIFGFKHEITAKLTGFGSHVQIVNLDGNTSYETVPISKNQPVVPLIEKLPACGEIHPYAIKAGILRGEEAMQGVVLKGVGPDYDWSFFRENLSEGSIPSLRLGPQQRRTHFAQARLDAETPGGRPARNALYPESAAAGPFPRKRHLRHAVR